MIICFQSGKQKKLLNFLRSFLVGDDSLFRFFIGRFEPPTTSDEKSECSELPCLIPVFKFITTKKLQNQVTLEFLKFCGR